MIITGIQGTELEGLFKQFYEQMVAEQKILSQMIKELSGVEPLSVGMEAPSFIKRGFSCLWDYHKIIFPKGSIPKNMVYTYYSDDEEIYAPYPKLPCTKKFYSKCNRMFKGIDGKILSDYGIPVTSEYITFFWKPICYNGKYGIEVSDGIKQYLPNIKDKQYEIEVV